MKYKPVEKPRLVGCANCSPIPGKTLAKRHKWYVYGDVRLEVDGKGIASWMDETPMVQTIERKYKEQIAQGECALLKVSTPLHGEVYEYNKQDGKWYLVEQNQGFA